jgi:hypothetical protein
LQASQTVPSTPRQYVGPAGCSPQVPMAAPAALLQVPVQQSGPDEQTSPIWLQNDDTEQTPFLQSFEQHSAFAVQLLPSVLHVGFRVWQLPPAQLPLQQAALAVHAPLSLTHAAAHVPPVQLSEQQSALAAQVPPAATHAPPPPVPRQV